MARSCYPNRSIGGCRARSQLPYLYKVSSSGGGLFKRPVILLDPGRFLFAMMFSKDSQVSARLLHGADSHFLPASSSTVGTSSPFPDDKLR